MSDKMRWRYGEMKLGLGPLWIVLCLSLFLAGGCGSNDLSEGHITAKRHEPEHVWTQFVSVYVPKGHKILTVVMVPVEHVDDEDWVLTIQGCNRRGELINRDIYVCESVFNKLSIGDYYVYESDSASSSDPICKNGFEERSYVTR